METTRGGQAHTKKRETKGAHTHSAPSGKPAIKSSSCITFSLACRSTAATKLNVDPLMALRRWPMRPILYSSTCQHTLRADAGKPHSDTCTRMSNAQARPIPQPLILASWCGRRARGGETLFGEIGPPPSCVDNCLEDRRSRMTLSKASARPCPSSAPAEGAANHGSISRKGNCCEKPKSSLFEVLFCVASTDFTQKTNYTQNRFLLGKKRVWV